MAAETKMVVRVTATRGSVRVNWRAHGKTGTLYFPGYAGEEDGVATPTHSTNKAYWTEILNSVVSSLT